MKLNDYFRQQQANHISDTQKLDVYQDFLEKHMKTSFHRKRSLLHVKSFVYSLVILFMLFGFYGVYFLSDRYTEYEGLIMDATNTAQADYVAKVVEFTGPFSIKRNDKLLNTSFIEDGDIVTLKENTQLTFNINVSTKAKLVGPAQFSIQQISKGDIPQYKLNVIHGDFVEMKALQEKASEKVQLNIADKMMVQQANGKPIDFQLVKDGENSIVKNNGGSLLVTTLGQDNKEIKTNLAKSQVLAVQKNDITLYDDFKKFTSAMKSKNVSQTFTFNTAEQQLSEIETGTLETVEEVPLDMLLTATEETVDQNVSIQLGSLFSEEPSVISPEQEQALRSLLNKDFLLGDFKQVYGNILLGDEKGLNIAYVNLEKRIQQLYERFGLTYTKASGATVQAKLLNLKQSIQGLGSSIQTSYTIPPKYFETLRICTNRMDYLAKQTYSAGAGAGGSSTESIDANWSNLLKVLPSNLYLN